jgi:ankyrin repeat protein
MKITSENILEEANKGNLEVLKSDLVDQVKDDYGWTPLHRLAWKGKAEVLKHPSVDQVKDTWERTPLHVLASEGKLEVLKHPSVDQVKNKHGWTPLHILAWKGKVTKQHLKVKYPWFKVKGEITEELITEILSTPNSLRFILGG